MESAAGGGREWAGASAPSGAGRGPPGPAQELVEIALAAGAVAGRGWSPAPSCAGGRGGAGHPPSAASAGPAAAAPASSAVACAGTGACCAVPRQTLAGQSACLEDADPSAVAAQTGSSVVAVVEQPAAACAADAFAASSGSASVVDCVFVGARPAEGPCPECWEEAL